jgi:hypothetical protein
MGRFTFNSKNIINTTSVIYLSSASGSAANLFDRKVNTKWTSVGENSDANTATVSIVLPSSTIISGILLKNHNFEAFSVFYNSTPASQFSPALSVTSNTLSNTYYSFASQAVSSIDINITATHVTNAEKFLGQLIIFKEKKVELEVNPNFSDYTPIKFKKGRELELSDGGIVSVFLSQKFRATINLQDIPSATYHSLTAMYNEHDDFVFTPYPAATYTSAWNGESFAVNWLGDLDIDSLRSNILANGYRGTIQLGEIPS